MELQKFHQMMNDSHFCRLRKMSYKYPNDVQDFLSALKDLYYVTLPLQDFHGHPLVFVDGKVIISMTCYRLLMERQQKDYGEKAVEEEIISSSQIERIDCSRESVRRILKGYAPKDEAENRILGMKKGFDFICDRRNAITEENICRLYQMAIGDFLSEEVRMEGENRYRTGEVHVQDPDGTVVHTGMDFRQLPQAMADLVAFIGTDDGMNELLKAAVVHFYVAYIHPWFDGNGRMARLIHLWFLVQKGFDTALFVPFSHYIVQSVQNYYEAYTLVEENRKYTGVIDVTPFVLYFSENIYNVLQKYEIAADVFALYRKALADHQVTPKEARLWQFILSEYGTGEFSTKQLEKDYGDAAYATIRTFVLKFEKLELLCSQQFGPRVRYRVARQEGHSGG